MRAFVKLVLSYLWLANILAVVVAGENKYIRTSSLLTCMTDSHFQATFFDVKFTPHDNVVHFNIDATSTLVGEVVARVDLFAYGLNIIRKDVDFCALGQDLSALCQLKVGRINVNSTYTIGKDVVKDIPSVAYTIPDLDAQVRVAVYQKDDEEPKLLACVQAVLSNGKTVQTKYASWPIAAIAGVGIITSGLVSVVGHSTTSAHIASNSISLFIYFQNLAITSMMGVARVPPIAAAWAQNFQWSMGIIRVDFMQKLFRWYVQATGGTPVLVHSNREYLSVSVQKRRMKRALAEGARYLYEKVSTMGFYGLPQPMERVSISSANDVNFDHTYKEGALYTTSERDPNNFAKKVLVLHGIQRVAFKAGIELSNVFLTGISFFLIFIVAVVFSLIVFKALFDIFTRARVVSERSKFSEYRRHWANIIKGTLFRIAIIAFPQVSLLSIWEFTQSDSPATVIDAAVILLVLSTVLVYGATKVIIRGRKSARLYKAPAYLLYGDTAFLNRYGFLYVQFQANYYWWLMPLLSYSFLRSLVIAILQEHGKVQAMVVFCVELVYFIALCCTRPYLDKRTNIFNITLHLVNLLNAIFFLFFSGIFKQPPIVSSIMAIVLFFLNAAFALFLLIFTVFTCTFALVHRNPDSRYQPMKDDRVSFIPKVGGAAGKGESSLDNLGKAMLTTYGDIGEKKDDILLQPTSGQSALYDQDDSANLGTPLTASESPKIQSAIMGPNSFGMRPMYQRIPTAPSVTPDGRTDSSRHTSSTDSPIIRTASPLNSDTRYHEFVNNNSPPYPLTNNNTNNSPSYSAPTSRSNDSSNNNSNDFFEQTNGAYNRNPRYM